MGGAADIVFGWIDSKVHGLYMALVNFFQNFFANPPTVKHSSWTDYLFGNSLGLAGALSRAIFFTIVSFAILAFWWRRAMVNTLQALGIAVLIAALGQTFFWFCDWLLGLRSELTRAAMFNIPSQKGTPLMGELSTLVNILADIAAAGIVSVLGALLVLIFLIFELVRLFVMVTFLPVAALWPFSDKAKTWFDRLLAMGLVTMVTGVPTVVFIIQLGKAAGPVFNWGQTSVGSTFLTAASFVLALFVVVGMFKGAYRVISRGMSKVRNNLQSRVSGNVRATVAQPTSGSMLKSIQSQQAKGMQPPSIPPANAAAIGTAANQAGTAATRSQTVSNVKSTMATVSAASAAKASGAAATAGSVAAMGATGAATAGAVPAAIVAEKAVTVPIKIVRSAISTEDRKDR